MHSKIFKHLLTLFFVLVLLTIFTLHWNATQKATSTKNPQEINQQVNQQEVNQMEEQRKEAYLKTFGIPPELGISPEQIKTLEKNSLENKTAENNK